MVFRSICSAEVVFCSGLEVFCSAVVAFCSGLVVFRSICSSLVVFSSVVEVFYPVSSALVDSFSVCSAVEFFSPSVLPWWAPVPFVPPWGPPVSPASPWGAPVSSAPVASAQPWWSPVLSAPPWYSALPALPWFLVSSLPHGSGPPSFPRFHLRSTALLDCSEFVVSGSRSLGVGYVMNLVYELPLTHHQRSLAHHMDSCTTLTVALHLRLQFPSSIALTKHTADGTDHTLYYINHGLPLLLCQVLYSVYHSLSDSYSTEPTQLLPSCCVCFDNCPLFPGLTLCLAIRTLFALSWTTWTIISLPCPVGYCSPIEDLCLS